MLGKILAYKRYRRYLYLNRLLKIGEDDKIIDVGSGKEGRSYEVFNTTNQIVGIDLWHPKEIDQRLITQTNFKYIQGDAVDMSYFQDKAFDVAFCIGMLEHIVDKETLSKIAAEIRRVAKKYAICVPWRYAPLEPHFKLPLFQFYPERFQYWLIRTFNLHRLGDCSLAYFRAHYQWLSSSAWKEYFPDCNVSVSKSGLYLYLWKS